MSDLTDRVSYLRGLAEGLKLDDSRPEGTLIGKMLELLDAFAKDNDALHQSLDEMNEYVESIDEDLSDMEEAIYGDDEPDDEDGEEDEDEDEEDDDSEDDSTVEYACPYCGETMVFDVERFDFDEDYLCPNCHKPLFPEEDEDVEDEDEDQ